MCCGGAAGGVKGMEVGGEDAGGLEGHFFLGIDWICSVGVV